MKKTTVPEFSVKPLTKFSPAYGDDPSPEAPLSLRPFQPCGSRPEPRPCARQTNPPVTSSLSTECPIDCSSPKAGLLFGSSVFNRLSSLPAKTSNESRVKLPRLLALSFDGAHALAQSLKSVLATTPLLDFELCTESLSDSLPILPEQALSNAIQKVCPQWVVLCLPSPWEPLLSVLQAVRQHLGHRPVLFALDTTDPEECREALKLDPDDFITAPFRPVDLLPRLWRLQARSRPADPLIVQLKERLGLKQLVGESPALLAEIKKIPTVARCDATVLIAGETGTGKEMVARAVHHLGPRSAKSFVPVNCGALPVDLVENELFGHESGAFTGAHSSTVGLLQKADGGSLFLDEIDSLPLLAQVKLLRFLQEKEFRPLGATRACRADVRIIAASNINLEEAVRKGRLREDLYYRLNVIVLTLPPLRARREDIPLLARHFLTKYAAAFDSPAQDLTTCAMQKLMLYDWPGNVRELEHVIERSVVFSTERMLGADDIQLPRGLPVEEGESFQSVKARLIVQFERGYLLDLLRCQQGNITRAATAAGKNRRAFWELMRKHGIQVERTADH